MQHPQELAGRELLSQRWACPLLGPDPVTPPLKPLSFRTCFLLVLEGVRQGDGGALGQSADRLPSRRPIPGPPDSRAPDSRAACGPRWPQGWEVCTYWP